MVFSERLWIAFVHSVVSFDPASVSVPLLVNVHALLSPDYEVVPPLVPPLVNLLIF